MEQILTNYIVKNNLSLIEYFKGQTIKRGAKSGQMRNSYCFIKNNSTNEEYYISIVNEKDDKKDIMLFNDLEKFKKFDTKINPVWYKMSNGYIATNFTHNKKKIFRYFHQHILNHYSTNDNISIDHINRNTTDNRISNLRLATQTEQNFNQKERERGDNLLKEDKTEYSKKIKELIPKYIGYRKPSTDKKNQIHGEHFTIELKYLTPTGNKRIRKKTSKNTKYSLAWKLITAIKIRYSLMINDPVIKQNNSLNDNEILKDFITEQKDLIIQLAVIDNLRITTELLDLNKNDIEPKYMLKRDICSYCNKEITQAGMLRHIKTIHSDNN